MSSFFPSDVRKNVNPHFVPVIVLTYNQGNEVRHSQ